jgi:hypothetical protein
MKTTVTLRIRGSLSVHTVNARNSSSAGAIVLNQLPPYIDRLRDCQLISVVGEVKARDSDWDGEHKSTAFL